MFILIVELIGYCGRAAAYEITDSLGPFIIQSILILVAPALFAASIYMTLGRLMRSVHGERLSIIPVRWLTRLFVLGDVFSFLVQASGGGLMANDSFNRQTAQNIILAGLIIQIVMFGLFAVTAAIFHVRMRKWPTAASTDPNSKWQGTMWMLYAVSAFIMVRSIFRVVEYIMGYGSYPLTHEWTLYVFDATLMLLTVAAFGWFYPGKLTTKPREWEGDELNSVPQTADLEYQTSNAYNEARK